MNKQEAGHSDAAAITGNYINKDPFWSIPVILYTLLFVKNVNAFRLEEGDVERYRHIFLPEHRNRFLTDLEQVLQLGTTYDYRQYMPGTQLTNQEIRILVEKIYYFVRKHHEVLTK